MGLVHLTLDIVEVTFSTALKAIQHCIEKALDHDNETSTDSNQFNQSRSVKVTRLQFSYHTGICVTGLARCLQSVIHSWRGRGIH